MKTKIIVGAGAIILLVAIAGIVLVGSLDSIVKAAVEKVGTETTKTNVELDSATINLADAQGSLKGLSVANPAGFSDALAIDIGNISMTLDSSTVTADTIVIKEIRVDNPAISYEMGKDGNNFDVLKKNIQGSGQSGAYDSGGNKKLIIENLRINGGKIAVIAEALGGKELSTALPNIHLKDIGKESGGASPAEVAQKVLASITGKVGNAVSGLNLDKLKDVGAAIQEKSAGATDKVKEQLGGAGDKLKGLLQ
jgi:hypothetical protein